MNLYTYIAHNNSSGANELLSNYGFQATNSISELIKRLKEHWSKIDDKNKEIAYNIIQMNESIERADNKKKDFNKLTANAKENIKRYAPEAIVPLWDDLFKKLTLPE